MLGEKLVPYFQFEKKNFSLRGANLQRSQHPHHHDIKTTNGVSL
jgi:hypothetical protein